MYQVLSKNCHDSYILIFSTCMFRYVYPVVSILFFFKKSLFQNLLTMSNHERSAVK